MKRVITFVILSLGVLVAQAQERPISYEHSQELWAGFSLKKDLNKKFSINFDDQVRITEASQIRVNFLEAGIKYKFAKRAAFKVQYRYSIRNNFRNTERISFDLSYKWKIKPLKLELKYRGRFQNTVVVYTGQNFTYFRNKLVLTYKFNKKWSAYGSYENFYRFNDRDEIRGNRHEFGANYKINKQMQLKTFAQYDYDVNVKNPASRSVIGVIFKYEFD